MYRSVYSTVKISKQTSSTICPKIAFLYEIILHGFVFVLLPLIVINKKLRSEAATGGGVL